MIEIGGFDLSKAAIRRVHVTGRNIGKSMRIFALAMKPKYIAQGYTITNRRGRNKLVDVRRMK